jgi:hypothetical protein
MTNFYIITLSTITIPCLSEDRQALLRSMIYINIKNHAHKFIDFQALLNLILMIADNHFIL